jgi:UPF0716 protein FxsA
VVLVIVLIIAVPLIEIFVLAQVSAAIGFANALAVLLIVSLCGAWLAKRQGIGVLARTRETVAAGRVPGRELVDGAIILVAGVLMIVPGFVTDGVGLLLLLPPARALIRGMLQRRFRVQVFELGGGRAGTAYRSTGNGAAGNVPRRYEGPDDVIDV